MKKFNKIYEVATSKAYASNASILLIAASLNSSVRILPVGNPSSATDGSSIEYNVQRMVRNKAKPIAKAVHSGRSTADSLTMLDSFSTIEWETVATVTGELKSLGLKLNIRDKFDVDKEGKGYQEVITQQANLQLIERHEEMLDKLEESGIDVTDADGNLILLDISGKDKAIWTAVSDQSLYLSTFVDKFKHMTSKEDTLCIMHPAVVNATSLEAGTNFNNEIPIYTTGRSSKFGINGIPVIEDGNLNKMYKFIDANGDEITQEEYEKDKVNNKFLMVGFILLDRESLSADKSDETDTVDQTLALTRFIGKYFYRIMTIVDKERIIKMYFDAGARGLKPSKRVSE